MFEEVIYTHCNVGIDLLKEGKPVTNAGFKVYACSHSIFRGSDNDLPFLLSAAQSKLPFSEPSFMDDAYMYLVPDKGSSFMMEFHPNALDTSTEGNYSHRGGKFINQLLIGSFTDFYPCKLFRNSSIWNAKARGEAYYYETAPADLPVRSDVSGVAAQTGFSEIGAFAANGRRDALMSAVAFLIAQYTLPPEDRKFLVIRDDSSEKLELWIAAIEHAFSPRIAASIPFATRMDKFAAANRYALNQLGAYQPQLNLQDKSLKLRLRAMIVGVDERDRASAASARPTANSPFVLLDGKAKTAEFSANVTSAYYKSVTSYDNAHRRFTEAFLQAFDVAAPSADVLKLYGVFSGIENIAEISAAKLSNELQYLAKRKLTPSKPLTVMYSKVLAELPRFVREERAVTAELGTPDDWDASVPIADWLRAVAKIIGDVEADRKIGAILGY